MACPHLRRGSWGDASVCELTRARLDSFTANNVCDTRGKCDSYADYKKAHSMCFITTATCTAIGQGEECHELRAMRLMRDQWLSQQDYGSAEIADYYRTAPSICARIDATPDPESAYSEIFEKWVAPCVEHVDNNRMLSAFFHYKMMVAELRERYL